MHAGIYPGVSNVMAAHMISIARREYNPDWTYAAAAAGAASSSRAAGAQAASTSDSGAEATEAMPLRSGVATMEPNEGPPQSQSIMAKP